MVFLCVVLGIYRIYYILFNNYIMQDKLSILLILVALCFNASSQNATDKYYQMGITSYKNGKFSEAIQYLNKAIEIDPLNAGAYHNRGLSKGSLGDYRGAISDYNIVIELNPYHAETYFNRGVAKYGLNDYDGAIKDYNVALVFNPNYSKAYNNRGIAKYLLGDIDGACIDWSKAGELGMEDAYVLIVKYCS